MPNFEMEGLDEEQLKKVQAEIDRRVTEAVKTTTKKVTEDVTSSLRSEYETKLASEIEKTKAQVSMTDAEKIEALTEQLKAQQLAFEQSIMERKTEQALREAGLDSDSVTLLTPLIVKASDAQSLEGTLNAFVTTRKNAIDSALEKQAQTLAANATPPAGMGGQSHKQDPNAVFNSILGNKDADPRMAEAQAIQFLINQSAGEGA